MVEKSTVRILVLDDEPFMLKLLTHMLANQGFTHVTTSDSGRVVLGSFDIPENLPDLILLDLNMPEMDGIEFVRQLVKRSYAGSLILVSGEDERMLQAAEKLVVAHQIAILGHLNKPVSPQGLAALLEAWMTRSAVKPRAAKKAYSADEVRAAIANGELVNHYQPKVAVATGRVIGVETLVRWRHPQAGMVFPDQFIGVAEAHGLIGGLTRTVIAGALTFTKSWQQETGLALQMAINVSMDDLGSLDFADYVAGEAAAAGVPSKDVTLEVTESRLMQDMRVPLEVLMRLRLKRFRISIDDFGTGHSSLAQLRDMPFDELKIDRGFVHRAWADDTVRAIFNSSVALAKQLNMELVAEGVEDRADWDFVRHSGCNTAQGYFIGKPMPGNLLSGWIEEWDARELISAAS